MYPTVTLPMMFWSTVLEDEITVTNTARVIASANVVEPN